MNRHVVAALCLSACGSGAPPADVTTGDPPREPARFEPGVVSTRAIERAATFAPDGRVLVFARSEGRWGEEGGRAALYESRLEGERWSTPRRLPFSGRHEDDDPFFAPDGRRLYFTSTRPVDGGAKEDADVWVVERTDGAVWGDPRHLGERVNSAADEYSPAVTSDGTLYLASTREGGLGQGDLYRARPSDEGYEAPVNLGRTINGPGGEWNVFVSPDETLLVFEASGRATNRSPSGDLYVSYRRSGSWSPPVALAPINTPESELNARLGPDGERLYFVRSVREPDGHRHADLFSVGARAVLPHLADADEPRLVAVACSAHELVIVEAGTWRPLDRLPVGRGPHEVTVAPGARLAYTADYGIYPAPHEEPIEPGDLRWLEEESGTITEVDLAAGTRRRVIRLADCRRNHGILVSRDASTLWTTCEEEGTVQEIDVATGALTATWVTAPGSHHLVRTPDDAIVVAANVESGSVSIIRRREGRVSTVATGPGAEGLALSPDGRTLWVGNAQADALSVVDLATARVLDTFPSGGRFPVKLTFAADGRTVWVVNTFSRSLAVFDAESRALLRTHELDTPPLGILPLPDGEAMAVSLPRRNEIVVLSTATGQVMASVPGVSEADGMGWLPRSGAGQ